MTTTAANSDRTAQQNFASASELKTTSAANQDAESPQPQKQVKHDSLVQECPPLLCQPVAPASLQTGLANPREKALLAKRPQGISPTDTSQQNLEPNVYITTGGTRIKAMSNQDYAPRTTTRRVMPHDKAVHAYLEKFDTGDADNVENMNHHLMKQHILAYAANPLSAPVIERLGINDIRDLSPRQAMLLCAQITQDNNIYNDDAVERVNGPQSAYTSEARSAQTHMDNIPLQKFFRKNENGVCRNYAEMVQGIFIVLKAMQRPATSQLVNTYVKLPESHNHMWNAFYTIEPSGHIAVSQVDATWNDPSSERHGETDGSDFTFGDNRVRDYFRQKHLLEGTGNRPLERFENMLDRGIDILLVKFAADGEIDCSEIEKAGGWAILNEEIGRLPAPTQVEAYAMLSPMAQTILNVWRTTHGLPKIRTEHPQHN
ncbi:MAG: hypothetical protein QGI45_01950 [Myxococcota bacterium]|jgi:hypothetical protein|nr:hypothetical protein [Myxococcota bacterium]